MEGECKILLDATAATEARKQTTHNVKPSSKLTTALLAFTLCLAAAAAAVLVFNRHAKVRTRLRLVSELLKGLDVSHSEWPDSPEPSHSVTVF